MSQPRTSRVTGMMLALSLLLGIAGVASAQKAAIVTGLDFSEDAWWQYVQQKISDTGFYPGGIDQIDASFSSPAATDLMSYKLVVVLASENGLVNSNDVGDALGGYLAMVPGGAVLLFQPYTFQSGFTTPAVGGSFLANYALTTQGTNNDSSATKRGNVTANDPLVDGVTAFTCGTGCMRVTGQMPLPGATVVASWQDGTILAVRGNRRIDLNMLPADSTVITGSWKTAGGDLITNAILDLSSPMVQSPRQATFPGTGLGVSSMPVTFTFHNTSNGALSVTGIGIDGTGKGAFQFKSSQNPSPASPLVLGLGASFTAQAWFKPEEKGSYQATLYVTLDGLPRIESPLQGDTVGDLYVSVSPIDFGGIASATTAGPVTVRIENTGAGTIDLQQPVIGDTTHYTLHPVVPDPKITMAPGSTFSFDLTFVPGMTPGDYSTQITITSTDASSPLVIPVRGLAGPPHAQVAYTSLLLPDVPVGAMGMPMDINITNTGNSDLNVLSIAADKMDFVVPNAPTMMMPLTISARDTKSFQLIFAPQGPGLRTGKLTIQTNEPPPMGKPDSNQYVTLAGNGTQPKFHLSVKSLDFGTANIGQPGTPQTVDLINDGDGDLNVKDVSIAMGMSAASFSVSTPDALPFVLRAGNTVTATVSFVPTSAGMLTATLNAITDLPMGGTATVALTGTANGAVGQISPAMLNFGDTKVKQKATKTVTLTNAGNQDLTILKSSLSPMIGGVFAATLPTAGTKVMAGTSITVSIDCIPAMVGQAGGTLELDTDDPAVPGGTPFIVPLTVNGVIGNVTVNPSLLDFSAVPLYVGQTSATQMVRVTNVGTVAIGNLTLLPSGPDAAEFTVVTGFKAMLMPGDFSDIGIVYAPHVAKSQAMATLVISADGVQVPMMVALKGASMSALVSVQPTDLMFDRTFVGSTAMQKFAILSNDGAVPIAIDVIPPTSADFVVDLSTVNTMLAPGDTTKIPVTFAPQSPGDKSETIDVRLKGTMISVVQIGLDGTGATMPTDMMSQGCSAAPARATSPLSLWTLLLGTAVLLLARRRLGRPLPRS